MNDLNTHAHSDTLVIDADVCESYRELCEEYLNQLSRELDDVGLWDDHFSEHLDWPPFSCPEVKGLVWW